MQHSVVDSPESQHPVPFDQNALDLYQTTRNSLLNNIEGNMSDELKNNSIDELMQKGVEIAIRIGTIALLIIWCFQIIQPFITLVFWGVIIAIAIYPKFMQLVNLSGNRQSLMATLITIAMLLILAGPIIMLGGLVGDNAQVLAAHLKAGPIVIPPPPESVRTWPLVGKSIANFWDLASSNLESALGMLAPQIKVFAGWLLKAAASTGLGVLQFIASIIIAGILLAHSQAGYQNAFVIANRFAGEKGEELLMLAIATVRGVARGVLGVALIQSILAGLGFVVADVPGAGLLAILCLFLAIIQVGPGLVIIPVVIYVFSVKSTVFASVFLVWSVFVTLIDNVLKPLLMGKGIDIPMLVIFLGAIGGMLLSGIIGLFVGAVVLALGYKLFNAWLQNQSIEVQ